MTEVVFTADSYESLLADAKRLGFTYADEQGVDHIVVNGPMASGGSYFLNYVGPIEEASGVWGRLRANGSPSDLPSFSPSITQFAYVPEAEGWLNVATGSPAPDFVQTIGLIA